MGENSFLTSSLIKAAYKSKRLFLFAGPKGEVMASPSITSIINEHDLSLWDQLCKDEFDGQKIAMNIIFELLENQGFECKLTKLGKKIYLTSFIKTD